LLRVPTLGLMLMERTCKFTDANQKKAVVYMRLDKSRRHISIDTKSSTFEGAFSRSSAKHVQIRNMLKVYQGVETKAVIDKGAKHKRKMIDYSLVNVANRQRLNPFRCLRFSTKLQRVSRRQ